MLRFGYPEALWFLWLVPALFFLILFLQNRSQAVLVRGLGVKLTPYLSATLNTRKRRIKLVLKLLALTFFALALARPQVGSSKQEIKSEGVELMVALDVSRSMLAEDVKPNRLHFAKKQIEALLDLLGGDKVGLIAFAGSAILLSPMTTDKGALKMFLDSLSPESVRTQGTNFKKALLEAQDAFTRGGVETDRTSRVTRVILVASDGEDHEAGAIKVAQKLLDQGIRIFTYAFGTEKGGAIPIVDRFGRKRGFKRDKNNEIILSKTKGKFLQQLAKVGRGSFYHARLGGPTASLIYEDISKLEQAEFDAFYSTNYDEKYQIFLFFGLLLGLVDLFLGERKKVGKFWKGRFEVQA